MEDIKNIIKNLPKADLHNHLHLGGSFSMLEKQYPNARIQIPESYEGLNGLIDFINTAVASVMHNAAAMTYFMEMGIQQAIADNVTYLEASIDLGMVRFFNGRVDPLLDVVVALKDKYTSDIDFRPDLGINKDLPLDKVNKMGFACLDSGLFNGIDIYGKEHEQDLSGFVGIYRAAEKKGMKTKVHIGEFSDAHSIDRAIELLRPMEIQHGIRAADAISTMDKIVHNNIRMNICPASNICLGATSKITTHPIRKLFDHGINITVNTDDHLLFNKTISDQYLALLEHNIFSMDEIATLSKNAFN